MSEPAHFEVREVGMGSSSAVAGGEKKYIGSERRRDHRRSGMDQRSEVRFEPGEDDRRKDWGRRNDDIAGHMF